MRTNEQSEKKLQNEVIKWLKENKIKYIKIESNPMPTSSGVMRTNSHSGLSDLIVFYNNNVFFIELKNKIGKLTASQKKMLNYININDTDKPNNYIAVIVRSLAGLQKCLGFITPNDYKTTHGVLDYV